MIKLTQEQKNKMEYLFSYGTLRQQNVQLKNFGRLLDGAEDTLKKFTLKEIEITNEVVLEVSDKKFHPILSYTGNEKDKVVGTVFKITLDELLKADGYEVDDYKRVEVTLVSGIKSWVYVEKN
jgi:gamma-glutamylcyclotransferase (GGCT)/AIG2-like uncharacterized protein YtfP